MLAFEVFILVYICINPFKLNAMTIATHIVGFITANLSIIIAIILNLIAYYKIFMCFKDLISHLKEKAEEKEKLEKKGDHKFDENALTEELRSQDGNTHSNFNLDK